MNAEQLNIDDFVNYEAEYKSAIKGARPSSDGNLVGRCPFHDDQENSFSINLKTGQWHCFSEDRKGNFISFWAELNGVDNTEAYKQILEKYGKLEEPEQKKKPVKQNLKNYTLAEYSFQKHLPEDFLRETCRISTAKDRDGVQYLKMPYLNEENTTPVFRKRYGNKEFRWSWKSSGKLILYGDWRLPEVRKTGWAVLLEGESDTQTLWHLKIPALGVPGASNFNARMVPKLQDLKLYIHQEPDQGGRTFFTKICQILQEEEFTGEVYVWSCKQFGAKDPSELYVRDGAEKSAENIMKAVKDAAKIDINDLTDSIPESIKGEPVRLRHPAGWSYTERGISRINEKTGLPTIICRTPIILTQRLKSMETGEEKIEIAFKRDSQWSRAIYPRSTVFTSQNITVLADLGCTITSENAKQVVSFLAALEAENIDIIQKADSASTFGWQTKGRFLPGHGDDIVLDIEPSLRGRAAAYHASGTFDGWKNIMRPHRTRDKFRFILAASFTAPLLRIIQQRNFIVYNWADSRGGKTATLKAALSVWGDPDRLMVNFNATQVALERMAGFFCDLPLGIDERQLAGKQQDFIEKISYMLSNGTGKARGSKGGGLQTIHIWRTVALATGEEPLSTDTTQTGVSTRALEIYGGPFEDEKSASLMHQQVQADYGWAGPEFISRLLVTDERTIAEQYEKMMEELYAPENEITGAHIAGISAVALADAMIDTWIFENETEKSQNEAEQNDDLPEYLSQNCKKPLEIRNESWQRAVRMAKNIIQEQEASGTNDVNENAAQFIVDWILSNQNQFGSAVVGTCFGMLDEDKGKAYIFPSLFNQALQKSGFNPQKTLQYMADNNIITSKPIKGKKSRRFGVNKRFNGKVTRFIEFDLKRFAKPFDPLDEDAAADALGIGGDNQETGWRQLGLYETAPFDREEGAPELPF